MTIIVARKYSDRIEIAADGRIINSGQIITDNKEEVK